MALILAATKTAPAEREKGEKFPYHIYESM